MIALLNRRPMSCRLMQGLLLGCSVGVAGLPASASADSCEQQAGLILQRLQAEVIGPLDTAQRSQANDIMLDVCREREVAVQEQVQEAVDNAREEEREKAASWWKQPADKPGNKRLKRKQH